MLNCFYLSAKIHQNIESSKYFVKFLLFMDSGGIKSDKCHALFVSYFNIPVSRSLFLMLCCILRHSLPRLMRHATLNCTRLPIALSR